jgi:hypothetical protein
MSWIASLPILLAVAAGFPGSERAAFDLAIAGTRDAPPDLARLIVQFRREYLSGVRDQIRRAPAADFALESRALSRAILDRTPMREAIRRCGKIVGEVISAEGSRLADRADVAGLDRAAAGPYRLPGVWPESAAGNPAAAAASIAKAGEDFRSGKMSLDAVASRIVTDETNLLWAIWTGAGGDARPAKDLDERNGPYTIPGAPR